MGEHEGSKRDEVVCVCVCVRVCSCGSFLFCYFDILLSMRAADACCSLLLIAADACCSLLTTVMLLFVRSFVRKKGGKKKGRKKEEKRKKKGIKRKSRVRVFVVERRGRRSCTADDRTVYARKNIYIYMVSRARGAKQGVPVDLSYHVCIFFNTCTVSCRFVNFM